MYPFWVPKLHPDIQCRIDYVGHEGEPVLVVDNLFADAEALVDMAEAYGQFNQADAFYPGVRATAPELYAQGVRHYLSEVIHHAFGLQSENVTGMSVNFSLVTLPPGQLIPLQAIPHFDSIKPSELAAVHYLCGADKGGTSIYRHRSTGFESVNAERVDQYKKIVRDEMESIPYQPKYMNGSNEFFERIVSYEAVFNRLVMYRCTSLHSGNIAPDFILDSNPRTGRLTLNTFLFS